jgi:hypothetical protein
MKIYGTKKNSLTKDEGNGSTFPTTQVHEGVVDTINERSSVPVAVVAVATTMGMMPVVSVVSMGVGVRVFIRYIEKTECSSSFHFFALHMCGRSTDGRQDRSNLAPDIATNLAPNLAIIMIAQVDEWQAKSFPEKVGDFHCFLIEAIGVARTFPHSYSSRSGWNSTFQINS